ncbi:hypothetical protein P171DRAFT_432539, partial [Karstenula rhodostoma CBS 690.94]
MGLWRYVQRILLSPFYLLCAVARTVWTKLGLFQPYEIVEVPGRRLDTNRKLVWKNLLGLVALLVTLVLAMVIFFVWSSDRQGTTSIVLAPRAQSYQEIGEQLWTLGQLPGGSAAPVSQTLDDLDISLQVMLFSLDAASTNNLEDAPEDDEGGCSTDRWLASKLLPWKRLARVLALAEQARAEISTKRDGGSLSMVEELTQKLNAYKEDPERAYPAAMMLNATVLADVTLREDISRWQTYLTDFRALGLHFQTHDLQSYKCNAGWETRVLDKLGQVRDEELGRAPPPNAPAPPTEVGVTPWSDAFWYSTAAFVGFGALGTFYVALEQLGLPAPNMPEYLEPVYEYLEPVYYVPEQLIANYLAPEHIAGYIGHMV